ncbi:MAG: hypothetical protein KatS3mg008_0876 [Acidimicrobiales bacterium]|nr:MAG: hypothetical protein KatS3mg008_0876 [Acidimicrobiales bacterium]
MRHGEISPGEASEPPVDVVVFTPGTVGPPGRRLFLVQIVTLADALTVKFEKIQLAALARHLERLLGDLPPPDPDECRRARSGLIRPARPAWVAGEIGLAWDQRRDRFLISLEEEAPEGDPTAQHVTLAITRAQATAFVQRTAELLAAGRPLCPLCGDPVDPDGHMCPRSN